MKFSVKDFLSKCDQIHSFFFWKIKSNNNKNNKKPNNMRFYIFELLLPFRRNILLIVTRTREKGKQANNNSSKRYTWHIVTVNETENKIQSTCDKFEKVGLHLLFTIKYLHSHHRKRIAKIPNFCRYISNIHIMQGNDVLFLHQISVFWKFSLVLKEKENHQITVSS